MALKWMFELLDKTSGPARGISRELARVETQMRNIDREARRMRLGGAPANDNGLRGLRAQRRALGDLRAELRDQAGTRGGVFSGMFGPNGMLRAMGDLGNVLSPLMTVGGMAASVAGAVASEAIDAASAVTRYGVSLTTAAVQAADFADNNRLAFRTLLQSQGDANAAGDARSIQRNLVHYAAATPFELGTIMQQGQDIMAGGHNEAQMYRILRASGDVSTLHRGNTEFGDRFIELVNRAHGMGMTGRTLTQAQSLGINASDLLETVRQRMHLRTAADATAAISHHRVGGDAAVEDILETVRRTRSGGRLGGIQEEQASHVGGLISTLQSRFQEVFNDFDQSEGYQSLQRFLTFLTQLTDTTTETGSRIRATFVDVVGRALQGVTMVGDAFHLAIPLVQAFINGIAEGFGPITGFSGALWNLSDPDHARAVADLTARFHDMGVELGQVAAAILSIASHVDTLMTLGHIGADLAVGNQYGALSTGVGALWDSMHGTGTDAAAGLAQGLRDGSSSVSAASASLAQTVTNTAYSELDAHSPSRVFMQLGRFTAEGFAQGIEGHQDRVAGAVGGMMAVNARSLGSDGGTGGGAGALHIGAIHVTVQAHEGGDGEETGRAVGRGILAELTDAIEQINLQAH